MIQIGNVPEINEVKAHLNDLKKRGLIDTWELPYENLLTRRDAAIFFLSPAAGADLEEIRQEVNRIAGARYAPNPDVQLSRLGWRLEFDGVGAG